MEPRPKTTACATIDLPLMSTAGQLLCLGQPCQLKMRDPCFHHIPIGVIFIGT